MQSSRGRGGFTLIELIISLAITAVVGAFLAAFLAPQLQIYEALSEQNSAKSACAGVLNALQKKIEFGRDLSAGDGVISYTLVTKDGAISGLRIDGSELAGRMFPQLIRSGKEFTVHFAVDAPIVHITVSIQDAEDAKEIYTLTQSVRCLNASLPG